MNTKTVAQLIEALQKFPQDLPVVVLWDGHWSAITDIQVVPIGERSMKNDGYVLEIDADTFGSFEP